MSLLRDLLDACEPDGTLDERAGREIERRHPLLGQQIDLDGDTHDIAPAHERLRLFEPAPTQLAGQQSMTIEQTEEQTP